MTEWLQFAIKPSVVRRALRYALGVGMLLIAINHGDAIVRGDVSLARALRMVLTMMVPYAVSTASSIGVTADRAMNARLAGFGEAPTGTSVWLSGRRHTGASSSGVRSRSQECSGASNSVRDIFAMILCLAPA